MNLSLRRVRVADDVQLQVADIGHGPTLLCVHGFPLDHQMWRGQWEGLADEMRLLVPDLRGFGGSDLGNDELSMRRLADDLDAMLTQLAIDQPIIFCGLSMGGYVAWQFWQSYAERLQGLVLCDTRAQADTPEVARGRHYLADRVLREGPRQASQEMLPKLFAARQLEPPADFIQQTLDVMIATAPETIAGALRGMAARPDMSSALPQIDCPALLVCGQQDVITPPQEMRDVAAAMPQAEFVEISGAGHMAPLENPTAVNEAIRQFVASLGERR